MSISEIQQILVAALTGKVFIRVYQLILTTSCAAIVLLSWSLSLCAGVGGNISGVITDPAGAVIRGAGVKVVNSATNVGLAITTDAKGA